MKRWLSLILLVFSTGIAGVCIYNLSVFARQENKNTATPSRSTPPSRSQDGAVANPVSFPLPRGLPIADQITYHLQQSQADAAHGHRHRYVLANLYLAQNNPEKALTTLADLEKEYPLLTEYIWLKRSQALLRLGRTEDGRALQNNIRNRYPSAAVAAEVVYAQEDLTTLAKEYPSHPLAKQVLLKALQKEPKRVDLLLSLATYFPDDENIVPYLDRLRSIPNLKLQPDQWWAIGEGYFHNFAYTKASEAYARANPNPITAYRLGRSLHRAERKTEAVQAYRLVAQRYPQSPEAPRALLRLMQLVSPQEALQIADSIVNRYQDTAAEALLEKYYLQRDVLKTDSQKTRNEILQRFPQSAEAAQLLLATAQSQAKAGNLSLAIRTVTNLLQQNKESDYAAEAGFWAGKWSEKLGDRETGKKLYQYVLHHFPTSYYAWRSATALGWPVGDLSAVRNVTFPLDPPTSRQALPTGSPVLQELFLLGQDRDAYTLWQYTVRGKRVLNVREVFTDGIMRIVGGDYLLGIHQLDSLEWLDVSPSEEAQIPELLQHPLRDPYLYPLAYRDIVEPYARSRGLSPALVFGLIRQESRFEARIRSSAGALGLMQVIPETGEWIASKTGKKSYDLRNPQDNVEFGTWYLDYTHDRYQDNSMLAVASYNAGPGAVAEWVKDAIGDPDAFVEKIPYSETRDYVKKVFRNYWNYLRLYAPQVRAQFAQLQSSPSLASGTQNKKVP